MSGVSPALDVPARSPPARRRADRVHLLAGDSVRVPVGAVGVSQRPSAASHLGQMERVVVERGLRTTPPSPGEEKSLHVPGETLSAPWAVRAMPMVDGSPTQPLLALEKRCCPSESVVHLQGDVDLYNAGELRSCIEDLASSGQVRVVLDLEGLEFIDSSGLGAMVGGMRRLRQAGGELVLRHPRGHAAKILEISGLSRALAVEM